MVFDLLGNSYVTGSFQGTVDFDREHTVAGDTLTSTGSDGFVAAYDAEGTLRWVQAIDGAGDTFGSGIAIDHGNAGPADDLVYVTGAFGTSATYNGQTISGGTQDAFLLQLQSTGTATAFQAIPSGTSAIGRRLAVAATGNVVIAGEFSDTMVTTPITLPAAGLTDAFVMEYAVGSGVIRARGSAVPGPTAAWMSRSSRTGGIWTTMASSTM